jgi:hypothetical protein
MRMLLRVLVGLVLVIAAGVSSAAPKSPLLGAYFLDWGNGYTQLITIKSIRPDGSVIGINQGQEGNPPSPPGRPFTHPIHGTLNGNQLHLATAVSTYDLTVNSSGNNVTLQGTYTGKGGSTSVTLTKR